MIIAVTGANGSIGKELIPFLENLGHQVLIISSSTSDSEDNIFSYLDLQNKQIPFKADILMHLASINSNLEESQIDDEIDITKKILSALPSLQCKQIIFFSTSKVYGDNSFDMNYFEESSPLKPKCYYGKAKKICEELIFLESKANSLNALIFRMPPLLNQSNNSNIGKLINLSKRGLPIPSLAQGNLNKRSFISISNIKVVIDYVLKNTDIIKKNEIYNLTDDSVISINELLSISGSSRIYSLPMIAGKFLFRMPILKTILVKLYGNFVLDNTKLKSDMSVKLKTTAQSIKHLINK